MIKLTPNLPTEEMPEAYKEMLKVKPQEQQVQMELPKTDVYKGMKKLSSFKKIKRTYKLEHQKQQFLTDLKELFQHLKLTDHQYDTDLLVEFLNSTEAYFIYGSKDEREQSKYDVLLEIMTPFFGNKQDVLLKFVETIDNKVKKTNLFKRIYRRFYNFFFKTKKG
jgi:hypothetical protein